MSILLGPNLGRHYDPSYSPFSLSEGGLDELLKKTGFDKNDFFRAVDAGFNELMSMYVLNRKSDPKWYENKFMAPIYQSKIADEIGAVIKDSCEDILDTCDSPEEVVLECEDFFYAIVQELKEMFPGVASFLDGVFVTGDLQRMDARNRRDEDFELYEIYN